MTKLIDTSGELLLRRFHNGAKLIKPHNCSSPLENNWKSVSELMNMPFHVYFMDTESVIRNLSEHTAMNCGFNSAGDVIGKTTHAVATKESVEFEMRHDHSVIASNEMKIKDESYQRLKDEAMLRAVTIKFPLYGADNKTIGVFGCSLVIGMQNCCSLSEALSHVINAGLLNHFPVSQQVNPDLSGISKRERECLYYFARGKTAKETALLLNLSFRTVEAYILNLKKKLGCRHKRDLELMLWRI